MDKPIIRIRGLKKDFTLTPGMFSRKNTVVHAVDDVSLDINAGEIVGLIGESGSGKTTLARVLLGLSQATGGSAEIDGQDITRADRKILRAIRSKVAVVFQDPAANLNPRQTVESSIVRPLRISGVNAKEAHARAVEALEKVKLDKRYLSTYPHQLSGGQQQRIAIARALVLRPKIMILDEPTSALDISVQAQVLNLLLDLQEELGLTYLVITHDLNVIRYISDRIAVMYRGRLVEYGYTDEILDHPAHPYTVNLKQFVPVLDPNRRSDKHQSALASEPGAIQEVAENACVLIDSCPYATEQCRLQRPSMREVAPGHSAACLRPI